MLWTIFVILLIMWLLGMVTGYTLGGFIHILLIVALAAVLIRVIQGRRPIPWAWTAGGSASCWSCWA